MLRLSQDPEADSLLSEDAFALLVGMVLDQQIPLERAFAAPLELSRRLGAPLEPARIAAMDGAELVALFSTRPALHRFPAAMAERVGDLARLIVERYGGEAEAIWTGAKDGEELLNRVRRLPGFGEQKARIFVALLGKQLGVRPPGWQSAAGRFGEEGTRMSVADIDGPETLAEVRHYKAGMKAAAKSLATLEHAEQVTAAPRSRAAKESKPRSGRSR
jgi:uncharacterized HhH-GPD family protein